MIIKKIYTGKVVRKIKEFDNKMDKRFKDAGFGPASDKKLQKMGITREQYNNMRDTVAKVGTGYSIAKGKYATAALLGYDIYKRRRSK